MLWRRYHVRSGLGLLTTKIKLNMKSRYLIIPIPHPILIVDLALQCEKNRSKEAGTHVTHANEIDNSSSTDRRSGPSLTKILFKRRSARRQYDGGARIRPKLAEGCDS